MRPSPTILVALLALACSGADPAPDSGVDGGEPDPGEPLLAVSVRVPGVTQTAFVAFVPSLDADVEVDLAETLEVPSGGIAIGGIVPSELYLIDGDAPRMTRWRVGPDGTPSMTGELSFANVSPSASGASVNTFVFASPDRGYVFDTIILDMVLWDPTDLEIDGTVSIEELAIPGLIPLVGGRTVVRDGEIVVPVIYANFGGVIGPESRLVFLDPATDRITRIVEVPCASVSHLLLLEDGTIYGASDSSSVTNRIAELSNGTECIVRVDPGTYEVAEQTLITDRTDGVPAGGMYLASGTDIWMRVLDETLVPRGTLSIGELNGTEMWHWGRFDLRGDDLAMVLRERDPIAQSNLSFLIDGRMYSVATAADFSGGALTDMTGDEPLTGLGLPGIIVNAFRLR